MPAVTASAGRRRSLIVPREHGAWGILLVPMLTGACVGLGTGGGAAGLAPFSIAALALFWLRTPVESWIGIRARTPDELSLMRNIAIALVVVSLSGLIWLFWGGQNRVLLWIGAAAETAFVVQSVRKRIWRRARAASQMIGAAGLTATAPAAYCVVTVSLDVMAGSLWAANFLFANQIQFVQLRIHAAHTANRNEKISAGRWFLAGQIILMAVLAVACAEKLFGWYAAMAFLPVLLRGFAWLAVEPQSLAVQALGKSELAHVCTFGILLVLGDAPALTCFSELES